jgi:hypothetical protein
MRDRERAMDYVRRYTAVLEGEGVAADRRELEAWASLARVILASNEFFLVD